MPCINLLNNRRGPNYRYPLLLDRFSRASLCRPTKQIYTYIFLEDLKLSRKLKVVIPLWQKWYLASHDSRPTGLLYPSSLLISDTATLMTNGLTGITLDISFTMVSDTFQKFIFWGECICSSSFKLNIFLALKDDVVVCNVSVMLADNEEIVSFMFIGEYFSCQDHTNSQTWCN